MGKVKSLEDLKRVREEALQKRQAKVPQRPKGSYRGHGNGRHRRRCS
jgi:hypothetical protein